MTDRVDTNLNHMIHDTDNPRNTVFLFSEVRRRPDGGVLPVVEFWLQKKDNAGAYTDIHADLTVETIDMLIVGLIEHKINLEKELPR